MNKKNKDRFLEMEEEEELHSSPDKEKPIQLPPDILKLTASIPGMIAAQLLFAKVLKAKFDALIKEGFTREEALEIIKARGLEI